MVKNNNDKKDMLSFLKMEFRNLFKNTNFTFKEALSNYYELENQTQKTFIKFYLYYLFQNDERKINHYEYLIIKDYLNTFPSYQDLLNFYAKNPNSFEEIVKNLRNFDLYNERRIFVLKKIETYRKALQDKETRKQFIKTTKVSSPAVSRFLNGVDYAISQETFEKDQEFIKKVKSLF